MGTNTRGAGRDGFDVYAAYDGGNDGDDAGNHWLTGYFISVEPGQLCLWYGEPAAGNGDFVGEHFSMDAAKASAQAHFNVRQERWGRPISPLTWQEIRFARKHTARASTRHRHVDRAASRPAPTPTTKGAA